MAAYAGTITFYVLPPFHSRRNFWELSMWTFL